MRVVSAWRKSVRHSTRRSWPLPVSWRRSRVRIWNKLRLRLGDRVEADLTEEMRAHREMLEDRFRREGLSATEAHRKACAEFGPMAAAMEGSREAWSFLWLESLWSDTRYAFRTLLRDKAFAFTA